jgi:hypothetical protein
VPGCISGGTPFPGCKPPEGVKRDRCSPPLSVLVIENRCTSGAFHLTLRVCGSDRRSHAKARRTRSSVAGRYGPLRVTQQSHGNIRCNGPLVEHFILFCGFWCGSPAARVRRCCTRTRPILWASPGSGPWWESPRGVGAGEGTGPLPAQGSHARGTNRAMFPPLAK